MDSAILEAWGRGDCEAAAAAEAWLEAEFRDKVLGIATRRARARHARLQDTQAALDPPDESDLASRAIDRAMEELDLRVNGGLCYCDERADTTGRGRFIGRRTERRLGPRPRLTPSDNVPGLFVTIVDKRIRDLLRGPTQRSEAKRRAKQLREWGKGNRRSFAIVCHELREHWHGRALYLANGLLGRPMREQSGPGEQVVDFAFLAAIEAFDVRLRLEAEARAEEQKRGSYPKARSEPDFRLDAFSSVDALLSHRPEGDRGDRVGRLTGEPIDEERLKSLDTLDDAFDAFYHDHLRPCLRSAASSGYATLRAPSVRRSFHDFLLESEGLFVRGPMLVARSREWAHFARLSKGTPQSTYIALWTLILLQLRVAQFAADDEKTGQLVPRNLDSDPLPPELFEPQTLPWLELYSTTWGRVEDFRTLSRSELTDVQAMAEEASWAELLPPATEARRRRAAAARRLTGRFRARAVANLLESDLEAELASRVRGLVESTVDLARDADLSIDVQVTIAEWRSFIRHRLGLRKENARKKAFSRLDQEFKRFLGRDGEEQ